VRIGHEQKWKNILEHSNDVSFQTRNKGTHHHNFVYMVPTQMAPRAVSTSVCKPVAASTVEVPDDERHNAQNMLNY